jgi:hypothetical protein
MLANWIAFAILVVLVIANVCLFVQGHKLNKELDKLIRELLLRE